MIATPPDPSPSHLERRSFLHRAALMTLVAAAASRAMASDPLHLVTPAVSRGPFYPQQKPTDSDADLTRVGEPRRPRQGHDPLCQRTGDRSARQAAVRR